MSGIDRNSTLNTSVRLLYFCLYPHKAVEIKVTLRPTVSRPVRLGVRRPSGTRDQFVFFLEIFF
jgi:hypothetical protein